MGKTHSKPLAARHGRGTAWARHAMCESALILRAIHISCFLICAKRFFYSMLITNLLTYLLHGAQSFWRS